MGGGHESAAVAAPARLGSRRQGPEWLDTDLRLALMTGAVGWREKAAPYSVPELAVAAALAASSLATVSALVLAAGLQTSEVTVHGSARWACATLAAGSLLLVTAPALAWPVGWRPARTPPVWLLATLRVLARTSPAQLNEPGAADYAGATPSPITNWCPNACVRVRVSAPVAIEVAPL